MELEINYKWIENGGEYIFERKKYSRKDNFVVFV